MLRGLLFSGDESERLKEEDKRQANVKTVKPEANMTEKNECDHSARKQQSDSSTPGNGDC